MKLTFSWALLGDGHAAGDDVDLLGVEAGDDAVPVHGLVGDLEAFFWAIQSTPPRRSRWLAALVDEAKGGEVGVDAVYVCLLRRQGAARGHQAGERHQAGHHHPEVFPRHCDAISLSRGFARQDRHPGRWLAPSRRRGPGAGRAGTTGRPSPGPPLLRISQFYQSLGATQGARRGGATGKDGMLKNRGSVAAVILRGGWGMEDRRAAAVWASFCGDALALGVLWEYDARALRQRFGRLKGRWNRRPAITMPGGRPAISPITATRPWSCWPAGAAAPSFPPTSWPLAAAFRGLLGLPRRSHQGGPGQPGPPGADPLAAGSQSWTWPGAARIAPLLGPWPPIRRPSCWRPANRPASPTPRRR